MGKLSVKLRKNAQAFVENVQERIKADKISDYAIINCDQSGVQYELHSKRTLTFLGEKTVECVVNSEMAMSHSYTILPVLFKVPFRSFDSNYAYLGW